MAFICLAPGAFAQSENPSSFLLSPRLSLISNSPREIRFQWDLTNGQKAKEHTALFFAHGPILPASATVASYEWIAKGTETQSGDHLNVPEKYKNKIPVIMAREVGFMAGCRIGVVQLIFPEPEVAVNQETVSVSLPKGVISMRFGENDGQPFDALPKSFDIVSDAIIINSPPLFQHEPPKIKRWAAPYLDSPGVKCLATEEGIVKLSALPLINAFSGKPIMAEHIAVFQELRPCPALAIDQDGIPRPSGELRPSDQILFYAQKSNSAFSPFLASWITVDEKSHRPVDLLVESTSGAGAAPLWKPLHLEEDLVPMNDIKKNEEQQDFWMWTALDANGERVSFHAQETVDSITPEFRVRLRKEKKYVPWAADALHVSVNGKPCAKQLSDSQPSQADFIIQLAPGAIHDGTNEIRVAYDDPGGRASENTVYLDSMDIEYPCRAFLSPTAFAAKEMEQIAALPDHALLAWALSHSQTGDIEISVSAPGAKTIRLASPDQNVFFLSRETMIVPARIEPSLEASARTIDLSRQKQADVICILPRDWIPSLRPFTDDLKRDGYSSRAVAIEDIYDRFGDGRLSPHAIQDFLRFAYGNWEKPQPSYVLLIGDATWDYWGRFRNGVVNVVPAYQPDGEYAVDNWFVRCDLEDDLIPDMIISRWPLRDAQELEILIQKNLRFKQTPPLDDWLNRVFLLTDDEFESYTKELADSWIPKAFQVTERHITQYPLIDNIYLPEQSRALLRAKTSLAATEDIINIINRGVLYWQYFGHGAPNVLGKQRMFFGGGSKFSDVKKLLGNMKPNILWAFSCETTRFDYPRDKWNISIGEDLLLHPEGGSIAMLGATGRGYPQDHIHLARGMHEAAFRFQLPTFGLQYYAAQLIGSAMKKRFEPVDQFIIFGDPTLPMPKYITLPGTIQRQVDEFKFRWEIPESIDWSGEPSVWLQDGDQTNAIQASMQNQSLSGTIQTNTIRNLDNARVGFSASGNREGRVVVAHGSIAIPAPKAADTHIQPTTGKLPDLAFVEGSILTEPKSPRSGETVFFTGRIKNQGHATAENIAVEAYDSEPKRGLPSLEVTVGQRGAMIERIDPNQEARFQIRWDPVKNTGAHEIYLTMDPNELIAEIDEENNVVKTPLLVRAKADLVVDATRVSLRPSADGSRMMLDFEIANQGESPADNALIHLILNRPGREPATLILPRDPKTGLGSPTAIDPGKSYHAKGIGLPADFESIEIIADPDEVIDEETHANNRFLQKNLQK